MSWDVFLGVLGGLGAGSILNTIISYGLESRKERRHYERDKQRRAFEFQEYLSKLMAQRLYRMRRIYWSKQDGSSLDAKVVKSEYGEVVTEWNSAINANLAKLEVFFNHGMREKFEKEITTQFIRVGAAGERILKDLEDSIELDDYWRQIDELNAETYEFDRLLLSLLVSSKFR